MKKPIEEVVEKARKSLFKQETPLIQVLDDSVLIARQALAQHQQNEFPKLLKDLQGAVECLELLGVNCTHLNKTIESASNVEVES